jgi:fluoride exporter
VTALTWAGIALLGGAGAVARFGIDRAVIARAGRGFPFGTLAVNVSGAFALGVLVGAAVGDDALKLAGTGFLGAYTTFSTWMFESQRLAEEGDGRGALANLLISVALGIAAAWLGRKIGGAL